MSKSTSRRCRHAVMAGLLLAWPNMSTASDEDIRAASAAWDEYDNAGDIDRLAELYHQDAVSLVPGSPASIRRDAIRRDFAKFLEANGAVHQTDIQNVVVSGEIAVERAHYRHEITPKEGAPVDEMGKHVVVYSRGDDGVSRVLWEIWNEGQ